MSFGTSFEGERGSRPLRYECDMVFTNLNNFYIMPHRNLMDCGAFPGAKGTGLKFKTTSQRYYFFLMQPQHEDRIMDCVREMIESEWKKHFETVL